MRWHGGVFMGVLDLLTGDDALGFRNRYLTGVSVKSLMGRPR